MILATRMTMKFIKDNPEYCLTGIDWENCFNNTIRRMMLQLTHSKLPELYPIVYQKYGKSTKLITVNGMVIEFQEGMQQGDVLSNILLGITQKEFHDEVKQRRLEIDPEHHEV